MSLLGRLLRDERGAGAAEFALVLPAALLILLGTIDVGRYAWNLNRLEKAAQMGTRYAVATKIIPAGTAGLNSKDFTGIVCPTTGTLAAGLTICKEALGTITCTKASTTVACTCANSSLGPASCTNTVGAWDSTATGPFAKIAARIRRFAPQVKDWNITVTYAGSGIGYVGDPALDANNAALTDVSPIVTITIKDAKMSTLTLMGRGIKLPTSSYSLTLEDGDGVIAY